MVCWEASGSVPASLYVFSGTLRGTCETTLKWLGTVGCSRYHDVKYILLHCFCDLAFRLTAFMAALAIAMIHVQVHFQYMPAVHVCALLKG